MKAKRLALPFAALVALVALTGTASADEKRSFGCGYGKNVDQEELKSRAPHIGIQRVLEEYRVRWDAANARAQCKAFAEGKPYEIGCMYGRRNWDEISAMVPDEVWGMSKENVRPVYLKLQAEDDGHKAALDYCREVGAIPKKWTR